MTPAINSAKKASVKFNIHSYTHDPSADSYGEEAAGKLGINPDRVFKTLVVALKGKELAVSIVPVAKRLDLKAVAKVFGVKKTAMADKQQVQKTTGYVLGGVSPLGQKKRLKTVIDSSASDFETVYVSAGRRGLEIELAPDDLKQLTKAVMASISR